MGAAESVIIEKLLTDLARSFEKNPGADWYAEIQLADGGEEGPWVQVTADAINFHYPAAEPPIEHLKALKIPPLPGMRVESWEPGKFATLQLADGTDLHWLSHFIDGLFTSLDGCGTSYTLQTEITQL
jgi:hypothetical protein